MNTTNPSWDSKADFLYEYTSIKEQMKRGAGGAYDDIRMLRSKEFRNTVAIADQGFYVTEDGTRVTIQGDEEMIRGTRFYSEELPHAKKRDIPFDTVIDVQNIDCLQCAKDMIAEGYDPAVLNMASRRNPGGGVITGAGAQEETLFRRTNLFRSLYQFASYAGMYGLRKSRHQYPLDRNFGGVYTPGATLFREGESKGYRLMDTPVRMSFIAVAGINRPELTPDGKEIEPYLVPGMKNKIRTILRIGLDRGHDSLVLGALGCGAFRNPPRHVARLFHEVLDEDEFRGQYAKIVFAILEDHNSRLSHNPDGNFLPFKQEFS